MKLSSEEISSLWLEAEKYIEKNLVVEFKGKQFVFKGVKRIPKTNSLPVMDAVKALGGVCKKDVTGSVDYLVYGMGYETDDVGKAVASQTVKIITAADLEDAIKRENPNYFWTMENINNLWRDADKYIEKDISIVLPNKNFCFDGKYSENSYKYHIINEISENGGFCSDTLCGTTDYYVYSKGWETPLFGAAAHIQSKGKPIKIISYDMLEEAIEKINPKYIRMEKIIELIEGFLAHPSKDNFKGSNVVIYSDFESSEKKKIKYVLKKLGAKIQKASDDKTDFVIAEEYGRPLQCVEKYKNILKGLPKAKIIREADIYAAAIEEAEMIFSLSKEEKAKLGVKIYRSINGYDSCGGNSEYRSMLLGDGSYIENFAIDEDSQGLKDAKEFLKNIISGKYGTEKDLVCIAKESLKAFPDLISMFQERSYCWFSGYDGEVIALFAIACFLFASIDLNVIFEFVRDKWEFRGDYSGGYRLYWELSNIFPRGYNYREKCKEYSDMI